MDPLAVNGAACDLLLARLVPEQQKEKREGGYPPSPRCNSRGTNVAVRHLRDATVGHLPTVMLRHHMSLDDLGAHSPRSFLLSEEHRKIAPHLGQQGAREEGDVVHRVLRNGGGHNNRSLRGKWNLRNAAQDLHEACSMPTVQRRMGAFRLPCGQSS